jgi:hypothetical protein
LRNVSKRTLPISKRLSTLEVDEETGVLTLTLPDYEENEFVTTPSLLFMTIADKITNDPEWVQALIHSAEQQMIPPTVH